MPSNKIQELVCKIANYTKCVIQNHNLYNKNIVKMLLENAQMAYLSTRLSSLTGHTMRKRDLEICVAHIHNNVNGARPAMSFVACI